MSKALIVVDVQKDFCEGGSLAVAGGNDLAVRIKAQIDNLPSDTLLVFTKDFHRPDSDNGGHIALPPAAPDFVDTWPPHCIQGTEGVYLNDALADFEQYAATFYKGDGVPAYSGFEGRTRKEFSDQGTYMLGDFLRGFNVTDVDVVGIAADYCVRATALDGITEGFRVNVLADMTVGIAAQGAEVAAEVNEKQAAQV